MGLFSSLKILKVSAFQQGAALKSYGSDDLRCKPLDFRCFSRELYLKIMISAAACFILIRRAVLPGGKPVKKHIDVIAVLEQPTIPSMDGCKSPCRHRPS